MKKCFSRYRLALFALSLITCSAIAKQHWSGSHVKNVSNEDLVIEGDVILPKGGTLIEAIDKDVTVYLQPTNDTSGVTVSGHKKHASQLYLRACSGRTIRFVGDYNLTFIGSESGNALLCVQGGNGEVNFALGANNSVSFTSGDDNGGVEYYVLMATAQDVSPCHDEYTYEDEYSASTWSHHSSRCSMPTLSFSPLEKRTLRDANNTVVIGKKSLLSYLSSIPIPYVCDQALLGDDAATISFDAASTGTGRMILLIENGGAFVVSGNLTTQEVLTDIKLKDIDRSVAAGSKAIWSIYNSQGHSATAGLLVENKNNRFFELLSDPFGNLNTRSAARQFKGSFDGVRFGAVLGSNGILQVDSHSFLDYVGLRLNKIPKIKNIPSCDVECTIKKRNPSALFIDGNHNPNSTPARIQLHEKSALFFRSGVGKNGKVRGIDNNNPFTVDASNRVHGAGNIVLDVEGELIVSGARIHGENTTKIEILSLEVESGRGSLFIGSHEHNFPSRTFEKEDGQFLRYNTAAFLINNAATLINTTLSHTDENHKIYQENDIRSEPTYIGGEKFALEHTLTRPSIRFNNSTFALHTSAALTGVDLVVPNVLTSEGLNHANVSRFIFYANSPVIDNGTGRQLILGTQIGAYSANDCGFISGDAHLDIIQQSNGGDGSYTRDANSIQTLLFGTANNDGTTNPNNGLAPRSVIHTIFLGNSSNISIGINSDFTDVNTQPTLLIDGNFFSFTTKGGPIGEPDTSNITGKGGMFVDLNGTVSINPDFRSSFAMMVTKSHNGIVNLPGSQVFFDDRVGIADWKVDLRNPNNRIIVAADQVLSDYTFNWIVTKKDFKNFIPYDVGDVTMCGCPPATAANIASLPVIQGSVDQLQIQGTRIGDPAQIVIDGGTVREIVFLDNNLSAEAPVAVIILQNEGFVGLGSANVTRDSLDATTTLGVNGIMIIANGSGQIELNQDLLINNVCAIVKGPDFQPGDVLQINTTVPREIRIKAGGVLDLTTFGVDSGLIQLIGSSSVFVEAGATIILGGNTLTFGENSMLQFEAAPNVASFFNAIPLGTIDETLAITTVDAALPHNELSSLLNFGNGLQNTDAFRVRLVGQGVLEFTDNAQVFLPINTFVGVETISQGMNCQIPVTNIELRLTGNSKFVMGQLNNTQGGVFQVGNVQDFGPSHSVSFTLTIDGSDANFSIGSYGYLGLGVGIEDYDGVNSLGQLVPNKLLVNNLFNVNSITLNFQQGQFTHDREFSGDDPESSLMAISNATGVEYSLLFNQANLSAFDLAGGGNIALINSGNGAIAPIVRDQNGVITDRLTVGILASTPLLASQNDLVDVNGLTFFDAIATNDALLATTIPNAQGRANAAPVEQGVAILPNQIRVDAVINGEIVRFTTSNVLGIGTQDSILQSAIEIGAVFINIDPTTGQIVQVSSF